MWSPAATSRRRPALARAVVLAASGAALVSALWGLAVGVPRLDDSRRHWDALAPGAVPVGSLYGLGGPTWRNLRAAVRPDDRFAVIAEGDSQYDVRNYAMYTLLPAIQTYDTSEATVVIYYGVRPPAHGCVPMGKGVCLVRVSS